MAVRRDRTVDLNLDSLLDTLTNVTGFLLIVIVVARVGASTAVQRLSSDSGGTGAGVGDVARLRADVSATHQKLADLRARRAQLPATPASGNAELERLRATEVELRTLAQPPANPPFPSDLERGRRRTEELREEHDRLLRASAAAIAAASNAPPGTFELRVPVERPDPEGARWVVFACWRGRIAETEVGNLTTQVISAVKKKENALETGRESQSTVLNNLLAKLDTECWNFNKKGGFMEAKLKKEDLASSITFTIRQPPQGETNEELQSGNSKFAMRVNGLDPKSHVARLLVFPDSFAVAATALSIIERSDVCVDWAPSDSDMTIEIGIFGSVGPTSH